MKKVKAKTTKKSTTTKKKTKTKVSKKTTKALTPEQKAKKNKKRLIPPKELKPIDKVKFNKWWTYLFYYYNDLVDDGDKSVFAYLSYTKNVYLNPENKEIIQSGEGKINLACFDIPSDKIGKGIVDQLVKSVKQTIKSGKIKGSKLDVKDLDEFLYDVGVLYLTAFKNKINNHMYEMVVDKTVPEHVQIAEDHIKELAKAHQPKIVEVQNEIN